MTQIDITRFTENLKVIGQWDEEDLVEYTRGWWACSLTYKGLSSSCKFYS